MTIRYAHTNIVAENYKKLAEFYMQALGCEIALPDSTLSGEWLERGIGITGAVIKGMTLTLPGYDKKGPTMEIFQYNEMQKNQQPPAANRQGFGHIAFYVDDVLSVTEKIVAAGGKRLGEIAEKSFKSGTLTFTYTTDPEGNIVELLKWVPK
jgi:predicted enzyme related to lactoylglutathione lyase